MKPNTRNIIPVILIGACTACIIILVFMSGVPYVSMIPAAAGVMFYMVFAEVNANDPLENLDHIQTGEGVLGTFSLFMAHRFITDNIAVLFLFMFIILAAMQAFTRHTVAPRGNGQSIQGLIIFAIAGSVAAYLVLFDNHFDDKLLIRCMTGHDVDILSHPFFYGSITTLWVFCSIGVLMFHPEYTLFSFGKKYFKGMVVPFSAMTWIHITLRSVTLAGALFFTGVLGATGFYMMQSLRFKYKYIITTLFMVNLVFLLFLIRETGSREIVLLTSFSISYATYALYLKKRKSLYA